MGTASDYTAYMFFLITDAFSTVIADEDIILVSD